MRDDSDISAEAAPLRLPLALEMELPSVGPPAVDVDVLALFSPDFVKQPSRYGFPLLTTFKPLRVLEVSFELPPARPEGL